MSAKPAPPESCIHPEQGRALDAYLDGELTPEQSDAFERHYFDCKACLQELQVLAVFLVWPGFMGRGTSQVSQPFVLELEGTFRGPHAEQARAPAGTPLELSLRVPASIKPETTYLVTVEDRAHTKVFTEGGVRPTGPSEVKVRIPAGTLHPGTHEVRVIEEGAEGVQPIRFRFDVITP